MNARARNGQTAPKLARHSSGASLSPRYWYSRTTVREAKEETLAGMLSESKGKRGHEAGFLCSKSVRTPESMAL
jgi:hypothetical protein